MEDKKLEFHINKNALKNFIASIINKQIGQKLDNLEQKNDTDLKEIKQIIKLSKELTKNLNTYSIKVKKKLSEQKLNQRQIINNKNKKSYSPSNILFKRGKTKKNTFFHYQNPKDNITKNNNLLNKRPLTPLKNIKKSNTKYKNYFNISSKSIDIPRKNKINDILDIQSKFSLISNKTNKGKIKTPVRKKDKIYIKKISKTPEKLSKKKNEIDFDMNSLDNDIEITKISIHPDENQERISNLLNNIDKTRLTIRLGPLAEKIENEKLLIDEDIFSNISDNFYKSIEFIFDNLYSFLDIKSFFNIIMLNKSYFHLIIKLMITKLEKKIKNINKYLTALKNNNKSVNFKEEKIKQFEYNNRSMRALSILNSISIDNFFSEKKIDFEDKNIKLIFDLYFISIGKKKDVINCNFEKGYREKFIMNYFKKNNNQNNNIGKIIDNDLIKIQFNNEILNSIYEYSYDKLNIISPKNFQRINKNITWFCYLISNILEYLGILNKDNNKNVKEIYNVFCSRLNINEELVKKLKKVKDLF